jgi:creatinine amidohydrolase
MKAWRWERMDREALAGLLPEALVLLPIGATEQHGRHLPAGTDAILARLTCERAADLAAGGSTRPLIVAPALSLGASDHHLPFGATLSLRPETLLAVLLDIAASIAAQGGSRLAVVNGHGGNTGVCQAVAAAAAARHGLTVAHLDYWRLADPEDANVPGHAGEFETALMLAAYPDLVGEVRPRPCPPKVPVSAGVDVHSARLWRDIDGYSDDPGRAGAQRGERWLDQIVEAMAARFAELARLW